MDFATARRNMVESQLRTTRVTDRRVLDAFGRIPREVFVPKARRSLAYVDEDLSLDNGRWLMEPVPLGRMIQEAAVGPGDNVLVVGAATGYAAAVLGDLANAVFALESDATLAKQAADTTTELALDNVVVVEGPLSAGWPKEGPYDVILIDGSVEEVPQTLLDQLGDHGRLIAVVVGDDGVGRATLYGKRAGVVSHRVLFDANIQPLPGFERPKSFVF